tara:strand:- start:543 stop:851 length:309 start_codon:yes stop_codon:yes gene_type:complete
MLKYFSDAAFREDLKGQDQMYVYFYSPGCGPCVEVHPKVDKFGKNTNNLVYMVHADEGKELQEQLEVTAYPSIVLIKNNKVSKAGLGAQEVINIIEDGTSNK